MSEVTIKLNDKDAVALASLCKRAFFERVYPFAADASEAHRMLLALDSLGDELAKKGYAPR
jgi:hypothetical protein